MRLVVAICVVIAAACGDNIKGQPDAQQGSGDGGDGSGSSFCGNLVMENGEDCDDGDREADAICDENCHFTCGNGAFDTALGETCDTGITSGAGACPASCDDGDACTSDVLAGSECTAACEYAVISAPVDGDGCCPAGANANTDNDCTAMCGNGILETGELCDTAIVAGAGSCPTACNDSESCTTDALMSGGSCQARCVFTAITTNTPGDGCCRPGTLPAQDSDCQGCGNGIVEIGETCDTGIASGAGSCPTTCTDANACTSNVLSNMGTCTAACTFPPITLPANNDGCCPAPAAHANNDNDCSPVCRNGVVEGTEQCDDGNMINTDACRNDCTRAPTGFRFNTLVLKDPHAYASVIGCNDITNSLFGNAINEQLAANLNNDEDDDGFLDLSPVVVFRPLNQTAGATSPIGLEFANCTPPPASSSCTHDPTSQVVSLTATNQGTGTCLGTIAGTVRPYNPAVTVTTAPTGGTCFVSNTSTVTFTLAGVDITLTDAQIAAAYQGNPATGATNGLLRGFLSETAAYNIFLPADLPVVGGRSLGSLLRGGTGNCMSGSDKDTNNGVMGWWFYLNFTATVRPWTD
ncbi:MAG: DUF4215 domain-containing protein [Kofleriaceae bacterium]